MRYPEVRHFAGDSVAELVDVWRRALPRDPLDESTFVRKVLLDANFRREGFALAIDAEGTAVGFCLAVARHVGLEEDPPTTTTGWITAFGLLREWRGQGVGRALFARAEGYLRSTGARHAAIAPYVPNYFVPGVDEAAYPEAAAFLRATGWEPTGEALAMDACLADRDPLEGLEGARARLERDGIRVAPLTAEEIAPLFEFLRAETPADWRRHARQILLEGAPPADVTVALRQGEVVGYCQFEGSHFGPFGVSESARGQGVGTVLLAESLARMKARGEHCAWVVWTGERAAALYGRLGFRRTRRFRLFSEEL